MADGFEGSFSTRYLTLMEEAQGVVKGVGAPNVTFGSNRSVKNGVREGTIESTRVVNSHCRDEISIDPPRGSEMMERRREKKKRDREVERERERERDKKKRDKGF